MTSKHAIIMVIMMMVHINTSTGMVPTVHSLQDAQQDAALKWSVYVARSRRIWSKKRSVHRHAV